MRARTKSSKYSTKLECSTAIMDIIEAYKTLELPQYASREDVERIYRDLVAVYHPDRFTDNSRRRAWAEEKLKKINQAFHVIKTEGFPDTSPLGSTQSPSPQENKPDQRRSPVPSSPGPRARARKEVATLLLVAHAEALLVARCVSFAYVVVLAAAIWYDLLFTARILAYAALVIPILCHVMLAYDIIVIKPFLKPARADCIVAGVVWYLVWCFGVLFISTVIWQPLGNLSSMRVAESRAYYQAFHERWVDELAPVLSSAIRRDKELGLPAWPRGMQAYYLRSTREPPKPTGIYIHGLSDFYWAYWLSGETWKFQFGGKTTKRYTGCHEYAELQFHREHYPAWQRFMGVAPSRPSPSKARVDNLINRSRGLVVPSR